MNNEKTVTYAIIAACIIAIVMVGVVVLTNTSTKESFSELYFEDHTELPSELEVGESSSFTFTTVSHEVNTTSYTYLVSFGDSVIKQGTFKIAPEECISINTLFIPNDSTLVFMGNTTKQKHNHLQLNDPLNISIDIPVIGIINMTPVIVLIDPDENKTNVYTYDSKDPVSTLSDKETDTGFDLVSTKYTIRNNYGDVDITYTNTLSKYRYEPKKMSVLVISDTGTEYEINFWMIIKSDKDLVDT